MKTTNQLIDSVKKRAYTPGSAASYGPEFFLDLLNREIQDYIVPRIKMLGNEYQIITETFSVDPTTTTLKIPRRSLNYTLRDLVYVDPLCGPTQCDMITREDVQFFLNRCRDGMFPQKFYIDANNIVLLPAPNGSASVKISYFLRPSTLVLESLSRTIVDINRAANTVTLNAYPNFVTSGDKVDIVSADYPTDLSAKDLVVTAVDTTFSKVTFSGDISNVQIGDKFYEAETTIYPMIPDALESLLVERVCLRLAETQNDESAVGLARAAIQEMESGFKLLVENRVKSVRSPKIISRNNRLW